MEPSPYSMENVPLFFEPVDDLDAVYLLLDEQVELVQDELGTQSSDEPVSKSMSKVLPGVPMEMLPAHSSSSSSSVSGSEPVARFCTLSGTVRKSLISQPSGRLPVFFCRLRRLLWYLLDKKEDQVRAQFTPNGNTNATYLWVLMLCKMAFS